MASHMFYVPSAYHRSTSGWTLQTPPSAPTGLTAVAGIAQVQLTWNTVSGATTYNVYRSTTNGNTGAAPFATGIVSASYLNTGLTNGTTYYYQVTALNIFGESIKSAQASATPVAPAPPTGLTVFPGNTTNSLSWNAVSGADSYNVYRSTTNGNTGASPFITGITSTSYLNTGLTNGTTYYYQVTTIVGISESAKSTQAQGTPSAPVGAQPILGTYQLNRDDPLTRMSVSAPGTFSRSWMAGISHRVMQFNFETSRGVYDWTVTNQDITDAVNAGFRIVLRITNGAGGTNGLRPWVLSSGAQIFYFTSANSGSGLTVSLTTSGGVVTSASIVTAGSQYTPGTVYVNVIRSPGINAYLQVAVNGSGIPTSVSVAPSGTGGVAGAAGGSGYTNGTATTSMTEPVAVPWDLTWRDIWTEAVTEFAAQYANHPSVDLIQIAGLDITGGEFHLLGSNTGTDQTNWNAAPYSYNSTLLLNAWKYFIDLYNSLFPNKFIGINASTAIASGDGDNVVRNAIAYAITKIGPSRLCVQHNALAAKTVVSGQPQTLVATAYGQATIGYQELNDATTTSGTSGADRWRGTSTGLPITPDQFVTGMEIGAATAQHGVYIEGYPGNINNSGGTGNSGSPLSYTHYFPKTKIVLLEDYRGATPRRFSSDGQTNLWQLYLGGQITKQVLTGGIVAGNGYFICTITSEGTGNSSGGYWYCVPAGGDQSSCGPNQPAAAAGGAGPVYSYPNGYSQHWIKSGIWDPTCNQLCFSLIRSAARAFNQDAQEIGNFLRGHNSQVPTLIQPGCHFYWQTGSAFYANEPVYFWLDNQVDHNNNDNGTTIHWNKYYDEPFNNNTAWLDQNNIPYFPTPVHMMDAMTNFYLDTDPFGHGTDTGITYKFSAPRFQKFDENTEPIVQVQGSFDPSPVSKYKIVHNISVTYNPAANSGSGGYDLTWSGPKNLVLSYKVYTKTRTMKDGSGFASGTTDGQVLSTTGDDFQNCHWLSGAMARATILAPRFFAIVPQSLTSNFSEVFYPND